MIVILCTRINPNDIPANVKKEFQDKFAGETLEFRRINPATPEELRDMAYQPNVGAVYAQDRPLPTIIIKEKRIPFVFPSPTGLRQVTEIIVKSDPFSS